MLKRASSLPSRRKFLLTAPVAGAAAGLALGEGSLFAANAAAQGMTAPVPFQYIPVQTLMEDAKALEAKPGNNNLVDAKELAFAVVLTTETAKSAKEFEWHEGRDHIVQIVSGTTVYEVGGKPVSGRMTRPGEWLAATSEGATTLTLKQGDMLTIPRNTPHKRSTATSVTFILISPSGTVKA